MVDSTLTLFKTIFIKQCFVLKQLAELLKTSFQNPILKQEQLHLISAVIHLHIVSIHIELHVLMAEHSGWFGVSIVTGHIIG